MASSQGFEERVRSACLEAIRYRQSVHGDVLAAEVLQEPVTIEGEPIAVFALQRGIHKPRQLDGALALTTTPPKHRVDAPYADRFGSDGMSKKSMVPCSYMDFKASTAYNSA